MPKSEVEDDVIVISGMSGKCANSDNIGAFRHQIYNKIDMLTPSTRFQRSPDCPERYGAIPSTDKFDNGFFSIHENHVDIMDPVNRMGMEIVCEALWDAGISLEEIKGTKTCIYTGSCYSESEAKCAIALTSDQNQFLGMTKALMLDKIGYFLEIDGPKCGADSACSSSMYCIQQAVQALREGKVDYAICTGQNLIMSPGITRQFYLLGVLSITGACRSFDADASGYARSDGVLTVILQRAKDAKRQYARIEEVLTNCDGFKERGITYPSAEVQKILFENFYANIEVPINRIGYMEAHGTGTRVGDPVELSAIESYFCKDRKDPLYIGTVKPNLGHCEGASGMTSLIKACWILDSNKIAPNIHYRNPHPEVPGLHNGKLEVVTEVIDLPEDKPYIAINNFGFGGANGHLLLTNARRIKSPQDMSTTRLVCFSARTYEGIASMYNDVVSRSYDPDFIALVNSAFGGRTNMLDYRGYCLGDKNCYTELVTKEYRGDVKPLICLFDKFGVVGLAPQLMQFKRFQKHIKQVQDIFAVHNIQDILLTELACTEVNGSENILLLVVIQTGIVELFKEIQLNISYFVGRGIGELSAAYADGVVNLNQTILIAHRIVEALSKVKPISNDKLITDEMQNICKIKTPPSKWKLQQNANVHKNSAQYFASVLSKNTYLTVDQENLLIIGGDASKTENTVNICGANPDCSFLHAIGRLHLMSYYKTVNKLFAVDWPVKAETPMISPLVKWKYRKSWNNNVQIEDPEIKKSHIRLNNADWQSVIGHNIDGRVLFPATGYIRLVMMCFCDALEHPFRLDNVTFHRACTMSEEHDLTLTVQIQRATGEFKVTEDMTVVVSGTIKYEPNFDKEWVYLPPLPVPKQEDLMNKRDIYKELGLRGYYYQNQFKEMQSCDIGVTVAHIKWTEWCPFLDTMLQMKILNEDTRSLYVPTKIRQILINPARHLDIVYMNDDIKNSVLPVHHYKYQNVLRSGYIEIRGLEATSIPKRKNPVPVLEANRFVPYVGQLDFENIARVMVQTALENSYTTQVKIAEDFNDAPSSMEPMLPYILKSLNDQPLIQPELTLHCKAKQMFNNMAIVDRDIATDGSNFMVIGFNISQKEELYNMLKSAIKVGGYIISRESINANINIEGMTVVCEYTTKSEKIAMFQATHAMQESVQIHINENGFEWVEPLKNARINKDNIILYSENESYNGIMGLTKCLLRESGTETIANVLISDKQAPKFDLSQDLYKKQLSKNLSVNVFKDGVWGSYKHLPIDASLTVKTTHSYANNTLRGDLSSLSWFQGHLPINSNNRNMETIFIHCCGLNFKDVMLASGRITVESTESNRTKQDVTLGIEFSGYNENGNRVMGVVSSGALSNMVQVSREALWTIPDSWSMEQAATVPCIYLTNIYGLLIRARLQEGESILIHSATGGIGLSAINIALYYKCNIFVTVGTPEKKKYILDNYPSIPENHIGSSRDISFYEMILQLTNGQGVSVILNSLADDKLQLSVQCLGINGRFVEIGRFDCTNDSPLATELANKNAEYHGVMLDVILSSSGPKLNMISKYLTKGIADGYIKPIPYTNFCQNELEAAFRYMITGKHIGKIVLTLRQEKALKMESESLLLDAKPKVHCSPKGTYIILGGLGGFGLELADYLILQGARNIVLVSRRGITSGYQRLRMKIWKTYGCKIQISTMDCSTREGCEQMLKDAQKMGSVLGVFNLAVVLSDALMENQSKESFFNSYKPKAQCTIFLDEITRKLCPELQHFVVFSSVSCGRGNAGQTNYGYSNSVMERICEKRVVDGLPGKAVQWGVVGDVGIVADYKEQNVEIVIGGTLHQRIASCLESLDILLMSQDPIVSSMVVAEKQYGANDDDIISAVSRILSIKDIKTVSPNSTFPELGMDSMMAVEIKQTLERDFDMFLSPQELRNMNFSKLAELAGSKTEFGADITDKRNVEPLLKYCAYQDKGHMPLIVMKSSTLPKCMYLLPGVEGLATNFEPLVKHLNINVKCLQYSFDQLMDTVAEYAHHKYHILKQELSKDKPLLLGAHSLSAATALETLTLLENDGYVGTLLLLDGSPLLNKRLNAGLIGTGSEETIQNGLLLNTISAWLPAINLDPFKASLLHAKSLEEKCKLLIGALPDWNRPNDEFLVQLLSVVYKRIIAELNHFFKPRSYKSKIVLCKATIAIAANMPSDYGLQDIIDNNFDIVEFEGDHLSFLENDLFVKYVENICTINL